MIIGGNKVPGDSNSTALFEVLDLKKDLTMKPSWGLPRLVNVFARCASAYYWRNKIYIFGRYADVSTAKKNGTKTDIAYIGKEYENGQKWYQIRDGLENVLSTIFLPHFGDGVVAIIQEQQVQLLNLTSLTFGRIFTQHFIEFNRDHCAVQINETMTFVIGGINQNGQKTRSTLILDWISQSSRALEGKMMNNPRSKHLCGIHNFSKVVVTGGLDSPGESSEFLDLIDPNSIWNNFQEQDWPEQGNGGAMHTMDQGQLYYFRVAAIKIGQIYKFDGPLNKWTKMESNFKIDEAFISVVNIPYNFVL